VNGDGGVRVTCRWNYVGGMRRDWRLMTSDGDYQSSVIRERARRMTAAAAAAHGHIKVVLITDTFIRHMS